MIGTPPATDLMQAWRRQIGSREPTATARGPRPFVVIGYRRREASLGEFAPLRELTMIALYDERTDDGRLATRLVGVGGCVDADGLRFGGPDLTRFDKDLRLAPAAGGRGRRLDAADGALLAYALQLERFLERSARHPYMPRGRVPRLPVVVEEVVDRDSSVTLRSLPKRQILRLDSPRTELCGRFQTTAFDFYHTRFRTG